MGPQRMANFITAGTKRLVLLSTLHCHVLSPVLILEFFEEVAGDLLETAATGIQYAVPQPSIPAIGFGRRDRPVQNPHGPPWMKPKKTVELRPLHDRHTIKNKRNKEGGRREIDTVRFERRTYPTWPSTRSAFMMVILGVTVSRAAHRRQYPNVIQEQIRRQVAAHERDDNSHIKYESRTGLAATTTSARRWMVRAVLNVRSMIHTLIPSPR